MASRSGAPMKTRVQAAKSRASSANSSSGVGYAVFGLNQDHGAVDAWVTDSSRPPGATGSAARRRTCAQGNAAGECRNSAVMRSNRPSGRILDRSRHANGVRSVAPAVLATLRAAARAPCAASPPGHRTETSRADDAPAAGSVPIRWPSTQPSSDPGSPDRGPRSGSARARSSPPIPRPRSHPDRRQGKRNSSTLQTWDILTLRCGLKPSCDRSPFRHVICLISAAKASAGVA